MTALARTKAEPDDPIRGIMNDFANFFGLPWAEDILGTPADWSDKMGVPLPRDLIPTPADALDAGIKGATRGGLGMPRIPALPNPADTFPAPQPSDNGRSYGFETMFRQLPPPPLPPPKFAQGWYYQQDTEKRPAVRKR
jgi:hypothetical protein